MDSNWSKESSADWLRATLGLVRLPSRNRRLQGPACPPRGMGPGVPGGMGRAPAPVRRPSHLPAKVVLDTRTRQPAALSTSTAHGHHLGQVPAWADGGWRQ